MLERLLPRDDTLEEGVESVWRPVGGLRMHGRRSTRVPAHRAPSVVLVHGQVVSSRYMSPLVQILGRRFPTVAPDLPGFGRSDKPREVLSIRRLADALAAWMTADGIARAVLLGNSLGCQIAVECALRHPERVLGLVLQGPTPDPGQRRPARKLALALLNGQREKGRGVGPFLDYLQAGPRRALRTAQAVLADPIEEKLPKVMAPALVVRGAKDPVVSADWAARAAQLLPRASLREVPGAAHTIVTVAALELARVTTPFLLDLARAERRDGTLAFT